MLGNLFSAPIQALKEVVRIGGDSDLYFFKQPRHIKVAEDNSFFVVDKDQLLHFDKNGKFLGNLQKKGEGPGEFSVLRRYFVINNDLILHCYSPLKKN